MNTFALKVAAYVMWFLRWIVSIAAVIIVIAIGENLPPLRRLDDVVAPYRFTLQMFFGALLAVGFVMFMGGIMHLLFTSRSSTDGAFTFAELRRAWRDGTWRKSTRMRRFFVIAGGVALGMFGGAALTIVTASPGVKLLVILAVGYVVVRVVFARPR